MILFKVFYGFSVRVIKLHWLHSTSTIHNCIYEVLAPLMLCSSLLLKSVSVDDSIPEFIRGNNRFSGYFDNCIGVWDGTYIDAYVPASQHGRFRNRKGCV